MARFIVRIELIQGLPNANSNYDKLNEEMVNAGFSQIVPATTGNHHQLPTGNYYIIGDFNIEKITNDVKLTASKVSTGFTTLISEVIDMRFNGLDLSKN